MNCKILEKMKTFTRLKLFSSKQCKNYVHRTFSTQEVSKNGLLKIANPMIIFKIIFFPYSSGI